MNHDFVSVQLTQDNAQQLQRETQQYTQAEQSAPKMLPTAHSVGGVARMTLSNGHVQAAMDNTVSINARDLTSADPAQGIMATARSELGTPRGGTSLDPDKTLVTVPGGMTTTLRAAAMAGYVRQSETGAWVDAHAAKTPQAPAAGREQQQQAEEQPNAQDETPQIERLDDVSEASMNEFTSKLGNMDLTAAAESAIAGEDFTDDVVNRAATAMGQAPEQVKAKAVALRAAFEKQAHDVIGPGAHRVFDWARTHAMKDLQDAIRQQAYQGNTDGYRALARRYIASLPEIAPELILNSDDAAARGVRRECNGEITLVLPDVGRTSWRAAVASGVIGPRFK